jgi:hypothetical protein
MRILSAVTFSGKGFSSRLALRERAIITPKTIIMAMTICFFIFLSFNGAGG